jgi:hypothetical protein
LVACSSPYRRHAGRSSQLLSQGASMMPHGWGVILWGFLAGLGAGFGLAMANGIISLFAGGRR